MKRTYTITTTDGDVYTEATRLPDGRGWQVVDADSIYPEEYVARAVPEYGPRWAKDYAGPTHPPCYPCALAAEFAPSDMMCKGCPGPPRDPSQAPRSWSVMSTGNHQALVCDDDTGRSVAVAYDKADAPLLAAAPRLLAACEWALEIIIDSWGEEQIERGDDQAANVLRAAIAEAREER